MPRRADRSRTWFLRNYAALKGLDAEVFLASVTRAASDYGLDLVELESIARSALTWEIRIGDRTPTPVPDLSSSDG